MVAETNAAPLLSRLQPARKDSGLRMPGYYVWCSSVIRVHDTWHMFSSRWPERPPDEAASLDSVQLLQSYIDHSEIVRAEAAAPEGPYTFRETVLRPRGGAHWDHHCCHNPCIVRAGDGFVLFFQSCTGPDKWDRRIGYATAGDIEGPWSVCDEPLPLGGNAVNPAVWVEPDGAILMLYRASEMKIAAARAPSFAGPYRILNPDILPGIALEDPFIWRQGGLYHALLEDNRGQVTGHVRHGTHLVSENGASWRVYEQEPRAYTHTIEWADGTLATVDRRERPWLILEAGRPTHLVTGVLLDRRVWSVVQPLSRISQDPSMAEP